MPHTDDVVAPQARSPIQAIDRGVALLEAIAAAGPAGIPLSTLTSSTGLHASTGRTLLASLVFHGLVAQLESTRRYVLGPRFFELNRTYTLQHDLSAVAGPVLRGLWEVTQETVHLATLQHGRRVDLTVLVSPQILNINPSAMRSSPSPITPLLRTAAGKVLLAGLSGAEIDVLLRDVSGATDVDRVRAELAAVSEQGFATNFEEEAAGVCGIAAPIRDHNGRVVAAMCIGYPSVRHTTEYDNQLRDAAVASADEVSRLLGAPAPDNTTEEPKRAR